MLPGIFNPMLATPQFSPPTTLDPAFLASGLVLSNGNLTCTANGTPAANRSTRGTNARSSGKLYFEVLITFQRSIIGAGICDASYLPNGTAGADTHSSSYNSDGSLNAGGSGITASSYPNNSLIGVAVDVSNKLIYFASANTWQNSANPAAGTGGLNYVTTSPVYPLFWTNNVTNAETFNFGATAFTYTPPTGFVAWG